MRLTLNGQTIEFDGTTLRDLLVATGVEVEQKGVAVAVNDRVVSRLQWGECTLDEGDVVEVITAMQGG